MQARRQSRLKSILAFFIGIFGALAILGVFFKIMKLDGYVFFMTVGFVGEAAAFVTMGVLELIAGFGQEPSDVPSRRREVDAGSAIRDAEERIKHEFDSIFEALGQDVLRFHAEVQELAGEMGHARSSIRSMRGALDDASTGRLAEDAALLGERMGLLGQEMHGASAAAERIRAELDEMTERFEQFNAPSSRTDRHPHPRLVDGQLARIDRLAAGETV